MVNKKLADASQEPHVAEYMKIRQHIIGMIVMAGKERKLIPSNRELEKFFGVSRPTVHHALRDLVADGYLTAKPGIGTFTNPDQNLSLLSSSARIGVIVGDGKVTLYDRYMWSMLNCFVGKLLDGYHKYCVVNCNLTKSKGRELEEIQSFDLSGLIWIYPPTECLETIESLKTKYNLPVVVAGRMLDSVSSCSRAFRQEAYEIAKLMIQEGRRNFPFISYKLHWTADALEGIKMAHAEAGLPFNERLLMEASSSTLEDLERVFEMGMGPSGIIAYAMGAKLLEMLLRKGVNLETDCRVSILEWNLSEDISRKGLLVLRNDYESTARRMVANLVAQCEGTGGEALHETVSFTVERK